VQVKVNRKFRISTLVLGDGAKKKEVGADEESEKWRLGPNRVSKGIKCFSVLCR